MFCNYYDDEPVMFLEICRFEHFLWAVGKRGLVSWSVAVGGASVWNGRHWELWFTAWFRPGRGRNWWRKTADFTWWRHRRLRFGGGDEHGAVTTHPFHKKNDRLEGGGVSDEWIFMFSLSMFSLSVGWRLHNNKTNCSLSFGKFLYFNFKWNNFAYKF